MTDTFVLVHSPLVGPLTWSPVATALRGRGAEVLVPAVTDDENAPEPYWRQEAESAAAVLRHLPADRAPVLVGHSGAGQLLPAIAQVAARPAAAFVFVDAGLPGDGETRIDEMARSDPPFAAALRTHLENGGRFPEWTDEDLRAAIPDPALRRGVLAELHPRGLRFFDEPIPAVPGWRGVPCGYLRFSAPYAPSAAHAKRWGWVCREIDAGHFHMLVEPDTVASLVIEIADAARRRR